MSSVRDAIVNGGPLTMVSKEVFIRHEHIWYAKDGGWENHMCKAPYGAGSVYSMEVITEQRGAIACKKCEEVFHAYLRHQHRKQAPEST